MDEKDVKVYGYYIVPLPLKDEDFRQPSTGQL